MNYDVELNIVGDIIIMLSAMPEFYYVTGINPRTNSYWYQIDLSTGKLLNEYTNEGVCETFRIDNSKIHYLLIDKGEKKEIFRIEQALNK
jgi:hypothetical protein